MPLEPEFEALAHPDLVRLAKYCRELAGSRSLPLREDFRPAEVLRWLPGRLYILDVLDGGADYRFRLFGTFWAALDGEDLTGRTLSEIEASSPRLNGLRGQNDSVVRTRMPYHFIGRPKWRDKAIRVEVLYVPFTDDGQTVSMILAAGCCDVPLDTMILYRGEGLPDVAFEGADP